MWAAILAIFLPPSRILFSHLLGTSLIKIDSLSRRDDLLLRTTTLETATMSVAFKTSKNGEIVTIDEGEINEFKASLMGSFILPEDKEAYAESTHIWYVEYI